MDIELIAFIPLVPRDVMQIVYKYVWRDNYKRCIEEYTRIYVPHWDIDYCYFGYCNYRKPCPITNNGMHCAQPTWSPSRRAVHCPYVMFRDFPIKDYDDIDICRINADLIVGRLPKNY